MKILLTGSTGYIGRRLLPLLLDEGHEVICLVRDKRRFDYEDFTEDSLEKIHVLEADLSDKSTFKNIPKEVDAAYYFVHSMGTSSKGFSDKEKMLAENFVALVNQTDAKQIIYLGGIVGQESDLSEHLESRKNTEEILSQAKASVTVLRAAIIIGSGSASFEIIRDLTEKLPVMIAPKWVSTLCQPIGVRNVMEYLSGVLLNEACYDKTFDIGGKDILNYKDMLLTFAKVRKLNRFIITVPLLTPRLSSLWLYFVTSTSYPLSRSLVDSMVHDVIASNDDIKKIIPLRLFSYKESLEMAFSRINQKNIISSWKDAVHNKSMDQNFLDNIEVPQFGCLKDEREVEIRGNKEDVIENLWQIGGDRGWYYGNFMWQIRGVFDKVVGGVGLRRGRRSPVDLKPGDSLDFWRVLHADKKRGRLLLYAEMKLPGEAWLEFRVRNKDSKTIFCQTATFRPLGLIGRLYWYILVPFHGLIFPNMAKNIVHFNSK